MEELLTDAKRLKVWRVWTAHGAEGVGGLRCEECGRMTRYSSGSNPLIRTMSPYDAPGAWQADNERLIAMLAETKEWRGMAKELADGCGLHYIPVEEALVRKVWS